MPGYFKAYYANIRLFGSVVEDSSGNQISLTSDERLAVSNASGGPATQANPLTSKGYVDNLVTTSVANAVDGLSWRAPVDTVSASVPVAPTEGMRYINTTDQKVYTYTSGVWDAGETPNANWAVFVKDSDEEYTYNLDTTTWVMKSSGALPDATDVVKGKVSIGANINVTNGNISVNDGTETQTGVVQFATNGEVAASKAVQGNDSRLLKGYFSNTYATVTNFEVSHNLNSTKLIVQVWDSNGVVDAAVAQKVGAEATTLQISLNTASTVTVSVIALP